MKRTLFILVALVAFVFATAAGAATLSVVSDKTTYNTGETITLTVSGDGQGASSYSIFGRLNYTGSGTVVSNTQTQKSVGGTAWTTGPLANGPGFSESFNQLAFPAAFATSLPAKNPFSTITLIAGAVGIVNVDWDTGQTPGAALSFFGLGSAPGTTFTIVPVPEPTTAALLGLGLLGLVLGGGRRRS